MSAQGAITRQLLYAKIPEIHQFDLQIGNPYGPNPNFSNIQTAYQSELSNITANGGDFSKFYTSGLVFNYVRCLEYSIIASQSANTETLPSLIQQKITLLEAAFQSTP
jgi:hypothetical protein